MDAVLMDVMGHPRTRPRSIGGRILVDRRRPRPRAGRRSSIAGRRSLAANHDVAIELLTVSSPNVAEDVDAYELSRRARENGSPDATCTIVHDASPARGIVDDLAHVTRRSLVMAADKRPLRSGSSAASARRCCARPTARLCSGAERCRRSRAARTVPWTPPMVAAAWPALETKRNPAEVEHLDAEQCWRLLRSIRVGRLAVCAQGRPLIFPVNYVVDGESIVFVPPPAPVGRSAGQHRGLRGRRL